VACTLEYAPPETHALFVAGGTEPQATFGPAYDTWGLGLTAFSLFTGGGYPYSPTRLALAGPKPFDNPDAEEGLGWDPHLAARLLQAPCNYRIHPAFKLLAPEERAFLDMALDPDPAARASLGQLAASDLCRALGVRLNSSGNPDCSARGVHGPITGLEPAAMLPIAETVATASFINAGPGTSGAPAADAMPVSWGGMWMAQQADRPSLRSSAAAEWLPFGGGSSDVAAKAPAVPGPGAALAKSRWDFAALALPELAPAAPAALPPCWPLEPFRFGTPLSTAVGDAATWVFADTQPAGGPTAATAEGQYDKGAPRKEQVDRASAGGALFASKDMFLSTAVDLGRLVSAREYGAAQLGPGSATLLRAAGFSQEDRITAAPNAAAAVQDTTRQSGPALPLCSCQSAAGKEDTATVLAGLRAELARALQAGADARKIAQAAAAAEAAAKADAAAARLEAAEAALAVEAACAAAATAAAKVAAAKAEGNQAGEHERAAAAARISAAEACAADQLEAARREIVAAAAGAASQRIVGAALHRAVLAEATGRAQAAAVELNTALLAVHAQRSAEAAAAAHRQGQLCTEMAALQGALDAARQELAQMREAAGAQRARQAAEPAAANAAACEAAVRAALAQQGAALRQAVQAAAVAAGKGGGGEQIASIPEGGDEPPGDWAGGALEQSSGVHRRSAAADEVHVTGAFEAGSSASAADSKAAEVVSTAEGSVAPQEQQKGGTPAAVPSTKVSAASDDRSSGRDDGKAAGIEAVVDIVVVVAAVAPNAAAAVAVPSLLFMGDSGKGARAVTDAHARRGGRHGLHKRWDMMMVKATGALGISRGRARVVSSDCSTADVGTAAQQSVKRPGCRPHGGAWTPPVLPGLSACFRGSV
jgi:hypothetical protein